MLPNNNLLYQFGVCLDFKFQKILRKTAFNCTFFYVTCKKDVTRCYAALASYGQQFVDEEKGRNSKAILAADVMCDARVSTTTHFIRLGDKFFYQILVGAF